MKKRIISLISAIIMLAAFFTACGNSETPVGGNKPQTNDPQLVVAVNPVIVYGENDTVVPYNDINKAMSADSSASSLTAIAESDWKWVYNDPDRGWTYRAVYGFGRWQNGAGQQAKGVYAYNFTDKGSISVGPYNAKSHELATYGADEVSPVGLLLSAVTGAEEGLHYNIPRDGTMTIPAGTITAIEQVVGVKTGFLAEDGTPRSASVRIVFNDAQIWSGTLCNSTAAEDGVAVTTLAYPQFDKLPVKAGNTLRITVELNATANRDEDISKPLVNEEDNWQVVKKSTLVLDEDDTLQDSDVTSEDGSIKTITDYQFTFTMVNDPVYHELAADFVDTVMKRTGAEMLMGKDGKETKYELVLGVTDTRPDSQKIYDEIVKARADSAADYIIRLVGTKLYIVGANDTALEAATAYFLETFVKNDQGKIPAKYNYYNKPAHVTYTIAGQNVANYTIRTERYPSLIVQRAAEAVRDTVLEDCGYLLPIKALNYEGTDLGKNEIRIGPMNGALKVERVYDTRFNSGNWQNYVQIPSDGLLPGDDSYWRVRFDGKCVVIEGGEGYSANAGAMAFLADLVKTKAITTSYTKSGNYTSYYDWKDLYGYEKVDFSLAGGYGLAWEENFNYTGTDAQKEKELLKYWAVSHDPNNPDGSDTEMYIWHPRVYGKNYWVAADITGNNYLFEISKKRTEELDGSDFGWEAVRVISEGKMGFRYGIHESRMVMGTRNGACSSIWLATTPPYERKGPYLEIDIYENYGRDVFVPCTHHNQDGVYLGNYHFQAPYYQEACWYTPNEGENFYDTFHHITVDWSYDFINFYFDGVCVSEMPMFNYEDFKYYRTGVTIKLAMGVGGKSYSNMNELGQHGKLPSYTPHYWLGAENIGKFFELQLIDYTRIYQTDNSTIELKQAENEMRFTSGYGR